MYDRKEKGIDYEVNIYGKSDKIFSSKKHTERYNNVTPKRYYNYDCLRITNIEELDEEVEMQCIMVDNKTHTYLCNDFIVTHNTSFVFENMVIPLVEQDIKVAIISNEQRIHSFQQLLLIHILTQDLDYWELTRKKLKAGHFTDSQKEMLTLAQQISKEKYPNIKFVKLFDSDMGKAKKIIRKLSKLGYQAAIYDTLKVEDSFDRSTWEQLLIQSRQLFQLASKENIALVTTFQLALSTLNKRWLDAGCLSNGKQVKEVYSEMIYLRQIWDDEYTGEKHDCKAYRLKRDANGKLTKVKEMITLDKDKKYLVAFLDKTRNDEDKQTILYEWNGRFNKWTEIGYCTIYNDHAA